MNMVKVSKGKGKNLWAKDTHQSKQNQEKPQFSNNRDNHR